MKIQLQSLRILNCGPLRDVCIHFAAEGDSPVTVLAGANGSGKTTALELILGLAEMLLPFSSIAPVRPTLLRAEYVQGNWLADQEKFSLFYGTKPENAKLPEQYFGRAAAIGEFVEETEGSLVRSVKERIHQQQNLDSIDLFNDGPQDDNGSAETQKTMPSVLFFPHIRYLFPVEGDQIHKEDVAYRWIYSYQIVSQFKGSFDSYMIWLDYVQPNNFESAIDFLNSLNIDGKVFSIRRRDLKVVVKTPSGGTHFLEDMSSGEQHLLIILMELRRRLRPYSIVLIDEIENSLHPAFQKKLAILLKRMQALIPFQLIVTTHSLAIVEAFGPASTRILTEF